MNFLWGELASKYFHGSWHRQGQLPHPAESQSHCYFMLGLPIDLLPTRSQSSRCCSPHGLDHVPRGSIPLRARSPHGAAAFMGATPLRLPQTWYHICFGSIGLYEPRKLEES